MPEHGSLQEQVYVALQRAIFGRRLTPGALVREGQIIKAFGVSRAPVRQALARLESEGVLRKLVGRGHVLGDPDGPVHDADLASLTQEAGGDGPMRKIAGWRRIYERVERVVVHRSAFGSARVNEFELARHFDVGRLVARDVLTRLEALGMVQKDQGRRWAIVALDAPRLVHLNEIREHLEPVALRQSSGHLGRAELADMRQRLVERIEAYPAVAPESMYGLETDLHVTCLSACPNKEMLSALRRTHCVLTLSKHILGVEMPLPDYDPFLAEHLAVVDRLLDGDIAGAAIALGRHLASATPKVIERLARYQSEFRAPDFSFLTS